MSFVLQGRLADPERSSPGAYCPIERSLSVLGTRSAVLLLREAHYGTTRFDDFATRTGMTAASTSARLRELVDAGLLSLEPYREPGQRTRHGYALTGAGRDAVPIVLALAGWGTRHLPARGTPSMTHAECGAPIDLAVRCTAGHDVAPDDVVVTG